MPPRKHQFKQLMSGVGRVCQNAAASPEAARAASNVWRWFSERGFLSAGELLANRAVTG